MPELPLAWVGVSPAYSHFLSSHGCSSKGLSLQIHSPNICAIKSLGNSYAALPKYVILMLLSWKLSAARSLFLYKAFWLIPNSVLFPSKLQLYGSSLGSTSPHATSLQRAFAQVHLPSGNSLHHSLHFPWTLSPSHLSSQKPSSTLQTRPCSLF